jgi:Phage ABA sandwich domain
MTTDYDKMSDRELDALVAERVMGILKFTLENHEPYPWGASPESDATIPHYSTDIAAAWAVVERIRGFSRLYDFAAYAQSTPRAICVAALKAVGGAND